MIMLYRTLLKLKERNGLTDDLKNKIDIFFATGRITEEQYNELMDFIGTDSQLTGIVAIGFANEAPAKRPRKPFEEIIEYR